MSVISESFITVFEEENQADEVVEQLLDVGDLVTEMNDTGMVERAAKKALKNADSDNGETFGAMNVHGGIIPPGAKGYDKIRKDSRQATKFVNYALKHPYKS